MTVVIGNHEGLFLVQEEIKQCPMWIQTNNNWSTKLLTHTHAHIHTSLSGIESSIKDYLETGSFTILWSLKVITRTNHSVTNLPKTLNGFEPGKHDDTVSWTLTN